MVGWVRDAAWSMLRGSVSWGANRLSFAPEQALCPFCLQQRGSPVLETAGHFAVCPRFDGLWHEVQCLLVSAGMPIVVRRWFVLYGPESAYFSRRQYDVVVWIWAVLCAVSLAARRQFWAASWQRTWDSVEIVAVFRSALRQAAAAELAAATTWTPPEASNVSRYGRRQAKSKMAWQRRWSGIAMATPAGLLLKGDQNFDDGFVQRLVEECAPRRSR
eukprot:SAG31_NODE_15589_length_747_cov_19.029321_1_plen_216_part_01